MFSVSKESRITLMKRYQSINNDLGRIQNDHGLGLNPCVPVNK